MLKKRELAQFCSYYVNFNFSEFALATAQEVDFSVQSKGTEYVRQ